MNSPVIDPQVLHAIQTLQLQYIRALDNTDMAGWENCFADPGSYTCITRENEEQGLPVAMMLDDSRERIADRVKYVTKVWAGTYDDYRTRHFLQHLHSEQIDAAQGLYAVESQFMVAYTTGRGQSELLTVGTYLDQVVVNAEGARFRSRKAVLDTAVLPRYLVYPV